MTDIKVFYVADHKIDLSRSTVSKGEQHTQVEPKVLKVLLLLAQRQGEVVTHKEIMKHVWQGTEVVPNALQRCIAILRKELGDDAKAPSIIATHPRIGYSLLASVDWRDVSPNKFEASPTNNPRTERSRDSRQTSLTFLAFVLVVIFVIIVSGWQTSSPVQYTRLQQITQTDAHEIHARFSPNGEYLIFNRYAESCNNHLWARQVASGKETRLTLTPGQYGAVNFTRDGRELVFAARSHCDGVGMKHLTLGERSKCWHIATLDFAQALSQPSTPILRHQCQAGELENPVALADHKYLFLQSNQGRYQLKLYDDIEKSLTTFYALEKRYLYHFDYDPHHQRIVVMSRDKKLDNIIKLLDGNGELISRATIQLEDKMSQNQVFPAYFEPAGNYLLTTNHRGLYRLNFDGQLKKITTPEAKLLSAVKHPANHQLLAIKGNKDIDIAQLPLHTAEQKQAVAGLNRRYLPYESLSRTSSQERHAKYQPNGKHIAFISDRNGHDQLWLMLNNKISLLSPNPTQDLINNFAWSPDGQHIAWVSNDKLATTDLEGETKIIETSVPLYSVLSWFDEDNLLVTLNDPFPGSLYQLDINRNQLTSLNVNQVESASVHDQRLFYSTMDNKVFSRSLNNDSESPLQLTQLNGKAWLLNNGSIYSVTPASNELNQYNLEGQRKKSILRLKSTAWKISDLKDDKLLLNQFIAINNEIFTLE